MGILKEMIELIYQRFDYNIKMTYIIFNDESPTV